MIGMRPFDLAMPEVRAIHEARVEAALAGSRLSLVESRWRRRDGSVIEVESMGSVVPWKGRPAIHAVFRDITERKRMERALLEADRRKDEFLAMLSHELRNPLQPMRTAHALLAREALTERGRRALDITGRQLEHLTRLVEELLDVARMTQGKLQLRIERLDVREVVNEAIESVGGLLRARRHRLETDMPDTAVPVDGDALRLGQVVENLLANAAKYTDPGGRIVVRVRHDETVRIDVQDDGMGIAAEDLPRLFDLYAQAADARDRAQGGLGVGLALVRQLATLHGGGVSVASNGLGSGATFSITLPSARGG
jgi:signal transduction histidine kinase